MREGGHIQKEGQNNNKTSKVIQIYIYREREHRYLLEGLDEEKERWFLPPTSFLLFFSPRKKVRTPSLYWLLVKDSFHFFFLGLFYFRCDYCIYIYIMNSISVGNARLKFFSNLCSIVNRWAKFQVYWPNTFSPYINT